MPGGYLSFGIYQKLGGEREFGTFWLQLGLPTVVACAASWLLVAQQLPCAPGTYATQEAGTRSLYVQCGGSGTYGSA